MSSIDSLPPDQRAVLQMVLQRGRSYDEIAALLSIDRSAVRERALGALDALGPQTDVSAESRSLMTDYLLGQLPERVSGEVRERIAQSPAERAWARIVASEIGPLASQPLPEIPLGGESRRSPEPDQAVQRELVGAAGPSFEPAPPGPAAAFESAAAADRPPRPRRPPRGPASRRGGAILLGLGVLGAIAAVVVAIVLITSGGGGAHKQASGSTTAASSTPAATTSTSSTTPKVLGQINLNPPSGSGTTKGVAEVLRQGATDGIAIVAQNVPPNTKHDAYAVWLYNSPSDAHILGFVNPGVGTDGRLSTAGALPSNATHYKQIIVSLETKGNPRQPGKIILQGPLTGV